IKAVNNKDRNFTRASLAKLGSMPKRGAVTVGRPQRMSRDAAIRYECPTCVDGARVARIILTIWHIGRVAVMCPAFDRGAHGRWP
ncbi:MAG: hypothetical protein ACREFT_07350, partial [Acetobacteraceae bacterium]